METERVRRVATALEAFTSVVAELRSLVVEAWPERTRLYPPQIEQTLRFFLDAIFSRIRAAYVLILNECHWEAELAIRSVYEAHARCVLFCVTNDEQGVLHEFWERSLANSDRKSGLKAVSAGKLAPDASIDADVFALLSDPRFFETEPKENKRDRRRLDQTWSFPEVLKRIEGESSQSDLPLADLNALLHMYGMQSEILHVSAKYYDLLWDRAIRGDDLEILEDGHVARMLSDCVWLPAAAIYFCFKKLGIEEELQRKSLVLAEGFSVAIQDISAEFAGSQKNFYDEHFGRT